ncbi:MAG TPA: GNAT family N-acetyltransferase [Ignavibacteria bacterium]|nr:GNAT family N-acetyltransferase [Ignavibacteria bacterium]HMR38981.1 GNAT family N-acetyltransferase [Ignavibacteria bacterium]
MDITFRQIDPETDIPELSALAAKIWNAYYPDIISQKQIDYMLGQSYNAESLKKQMTEDKHIFTGAYKNSKMAGYISVSTVGSGEFFIHKLYVDTSLHMKGIGKALFKFVFKNENYTAIRLTVNRQNFKAVNFYFRIGFIIEKVADFDIGNGFVMNDFVMILKR